MQAIDLYVKTTKRAMLTLSFLAEKLNKRNLPGAEPIIINMKFFALVQRNCWRSLLVFLETQEGLLHKIVQ